MTADSSHMFFVCYLNEKNELVHRELKGEFLQDEIAYPPHAWDSYIISVTLCTPYRQAFTLIEKHSNKLFTQIEQYTTVTGKPAYTEMDTEDKVAIFGYYLHTELVKKGRIE